MTEEKLNLYQKLAKIRKIADVAVRDKKGYNYSYADIAQILAKVKAGMEKYGVSLIPSIIQGTSSVEKVVCTNTKFDKVGKPYDQTSTEYMYKADMVFRWVNDANPSEEIRIPWTVTGAQSDPSQSFGSGMTYCTRYFLMNYFQIPQVAADDVDGYRSKQKAAEASEDRAIAAEIIEKFDLALKSFLADHQEKAAEVKQFITRFAKNANYLNIKEPALASKLLTDFQNTYLNEKKESE